MKKVVLKLDYFDDKCKKKAMKSVSGFSGVESIAMDKDMKLTVTGDIDPVIIVAKLRKHCPTNIITVGPAKEPEKKSDPPKPDPPKKVDPYIRYNPPPYYVHQYPPPMPAYYGGPAIMEEDTTPGCVIC